MQKITPCLWFATEAEDAARFYASVFRNSEIREVSRYGEGAPVPAGTALMVDFVLDGVAFQALNGGRDAPLTIHGGDFALGKPRSTGRLGERGGPRLI